MPGALLTIWALSGCLQEDATVECDVMKCSVDVNSGNCNAPVPLRELNSRFTLYRCRNCNRFQNCNRFHARDKTSVQTHARARKVSHSAGMSTITIRQRFGTVLI